MEILFSHDHQQLLGYITYVKSSLDEWQVVDIMLTPDSDISAIDASDVVHAAFKNKEGKIYVCNQREILMLIRWGKMDLRSEEVIAGQIRTELPKDSCKVRVKPPTPEGIVKLELSIKHKPSPKLSFSDTRIERRHNVVLVADDDEFTRMLVKKSLDTHAVVYEVTTGNEVIEQYKKYTPDILFLDIHLPGIDGTKVLHDLHALDKSAYIIMLSADSSRENVEFSFKNGAKGFLVKPFLKEKLMELAHKCPTFY